MQAERISWVLFRETAGQNGTTVSVMTSAASGGAMITFQLELLHEFPVLLIFLLHKYRKLDIINEVLFAVRCMAVGLILVTILRMSGTIFLMNGISFQIDYLLLFMTASAFIVIYKWQVSPLLVMIICGALEVSVSYLMKMFF